MYVEAVPNRNSPPAVLLRESYRQDGKVKKRTIANLSGWSSDKVAALRRLLRDEPLVGVDEAFEVLRSRPHGHVAAVLGTLRRCGLRRILHTRPSRERDLIVAMIVSRIIEPRSKLATMRGLRNETLTSSLGECLGLEYVSEDEMYGALDWLLERQPNIERQLAKKHLVDGSLVLYDLTSTYFEGRTCELARFGYSRDGKRGKLQIVFGLLCDREGRPIAVEVFEGNTADPATLATQIAKLRDRFGLQRIVLVGDRGMITEARIREELEPVEGLDWITCLRSPQIRALLEGGALQLSLFDQRDLAEITHPDYPGERLVACLNPLLRAERERKRQALLEAAEKKLAAVAEAVRRSRRPLRGQDEIGIRVGRVLAKTKVGKHFSYTITEASFEYARDEQKIRAEAALDGLYVVRTSLTADVLDAEQAVETYKGLSVVERSFRRMKTVDLEVRPIHHRLPDRVRAHVLLCMLAYYVEWHMRRALRPVLFDDDDPEGARARRASVVAKAQRSDSALKKAASKRTEDDMPVHSFRTLLSDLATIARHKVSSEATGMVFDRVTRPTPVQQRALDLLGVGLIV